jgi:exopolysaccharide biosynthesis polyprenyl glycosylphosphotransferase
MAGAVDAVAGAAHSLTGDRPFSMWLRDWGLHAEMAIAFVAGTTAAFVVGQRPYVGLLALLTWLVGNYHQGRAVTTPLTRQFRSVGSSALLPLAALAAAVGFLGLAPVSIPQAFAAVAAGALCSVVCRSVRWRLQAPIRTVLVGDRAAIATATTHWARTSNVHVVGGLVVEPDLDDEAVPHEILGVPTTQRIDDAESLVRHWRADLVVVNTGPGVTSDLFRRLTWSLDGTRCAVGVSGVLESVSSHRITPGGLGRTAIMNVRSPRPSTVVRGVKSAFDRVAGAVLLVLALPLLLLMAVAVRLDSKGPALFKQTRIGKAGKPFTLYKMRTMVVDAEHLKPRLSEDNEFDDVLFKMKRDPRVTRLGNFLRSYSLDELPQLFNVVRGQMSLVGPRPFVPEEVARMDADALRRHVVQPGITGLWQVSGRSDLDWHESAQLDTYYADNWSLGGDLAIGVKTIKAVVAGKGAY